MARAPRVSVIDALLVVMVLIWGANFSVIKRAFIEIPPLPFNGLRLVIATSLFLAAIGVAMRRARTGRRGVSSVFYTTSRVTARDRRDIVLLGLVGHCCYQLGFVGGVAATSVANAALIIGTTPVAIAVLSAALGRERIGRLHWFGAAVSVVGVYFVVGVGAPDDGASLRGDLLMMLSVGCWAIYTLGATRLIPRHSPLFVTGMTMLAGMVPYLVIATPQMFAVDWAAVSAWSWWALVLSSVLALCVCYLIWYTAVQTIGPSHTAIYSNLVPVAAMAVAFLWLREPLSTAKVAGAAAIVGGVFLTRLGRKPGPVPIEE